MPAIRKPARLKIWRGKWHIFWTDFTEHPPAERRTCTGFSGKHPSKRCKDLLKDKLSKETDEAADAQKRGGAAAYKVPLAKALDRYLACCDERVETRRRNPQARDEGLSESSRRLIGKTVERFKKWLEETGRAMLKTGDLTGQIIKGYRLHYAGNGNRSAATIAAEVRNLRSALRWIDSLRPRMFRDFGYTIAPALKPGKGRGLKGIAFSPDELRAFLRAALERESPDYHLNVKRIKTTRNGKPIVGRPENFKQSPSKFSGTPLSRLFVLLALTGTRVGEILALRWSDVDIARGRITVHAQKTGETRFIPLIDAPEGEIAPGLVDLLKHWRLQAGEREYVLPHDGMDAPAFPKSAWTLVVKDCKSPITGPQKLRKNFTSYAASLGVPSAVAALWQGHSPAVAAEYYQQQVLERQQAADFEGAMGLDELIALQIPASLRGKGVKGA